MDIQQTATQLVSFLGKDPELITRFVEHPYSTTARATGSDERISKQDMSQVVTAAAALSNNQQLDMGDIATIASALLGQNDNSVHSLTSMMFGGGDTAQSTAAGQATAGTLDLGSLVNMAGLAATLMGAAGGGQSPTQAAKPGIDLSDGLDMAEIASLAGQFLGSSSPTSQKRSSQSTGGIDFGTIAQLAQAFLRR